jgi:platelet-activating factor acetylhydrolase IB subunit alpha
MELESKNAQLAQELSSTPSKKPEANSIDWIPKLPPRRALIGHRSAITSLAFHPIYNLLASSSEDASIRIWDWDTGDNEKTLKGHTKSVQDVHFDSKGHFLGTHLSSIFVNRSHLIS